MTSTKTKKGMIFKAKSFQPAKKTGFILKAKRIEDFFDKLAKAILENNK